MRSPRIERGLGILTRLEQEKIASDQTLLHTALRVISSPNEIRPFARAYSKKLRGEGKHVNPAGLHRTVEEIFRDGFPTPLSKQIWLNKLQELYAKPVRPNQNGARLDNQKTRREVDILQWLQDAKPNGNIYYTAIEFCKTQDQIERFIKAQIQELKTTGIEESLETVTDNLRFALQHNNLTVEVLERWNYILNDEATMEKLK